MVALGANKAAGCQSRSRHGWDHSQTGTPMFRRGGCGNHWLRLQSTFTVYAVRQEWHIKRPSTAQRKQAVNVTAGYVGKERNLTTVFRSFHYKADRAERRRAWHVSKKVLSAVHHQWLSMCGSSGRNECCPNSHGRLASSLSIRE